MVFRTSSVVQRPFHSVPHLCGLGIFRRQRESASRSETDDCRRESTCIAVVSKDLTTTNVVSFNSYKSKKVGGAHRGPFKPKTSSYGVVWDWSPVSPRLHVPKRGREEDRERRGKWEDWWVGEKWGTPGSFPIYDFFTENSCRPLFHNGVRLSLVVFQSSNSLSKRYPY